MPRTTALGLLLGLGLLAAPAPASAQGPGWWKWPSIVTETGSGLLLATAMQPYEKIGPLRGELLRFTAGSAISVAYECGGIDPNGCEIKDLWEREIGFVAGLVAWHYLRKALHW